MPRQSSIVENTQAIMVLLEGIELSTSPLLNEIEQRETLTLLSLVVLLGWQDRQFKHLWTVFPANWRGNSDRIVNRILNFIAKTIGQ